MDRSTAYLVLTHNGFTGDEASRILDVTMRQSYALTVPRTLPSLHIDVDYSGLNFRILVNDTGESVTL